MEKTSTWNVDSGLTEERKNQLRVLLSTFGGTLTPIMVLDILADNEKSEARNLLIPLLKQNIETLYDDRDTIIDPLRKAGHFPDMDDAEILIELSTYPMLAAKFMAPQTKIESAYLQGLKDSKAQVIPNSTAEKAIAVIKRLHKNTVTQKRQLKTAHADLEARKSLQAYIDAVTENNALDANISEIPRPRGRRKIPLTQKRRAIDRWRRWEDVKGYETKEKFCLREKCTKAELDKGRSYLRPDRQKFGKNKNSKSPK